MAYPAFGKMAKRKRIIESDMRWNVSEKVEVSRHIVEY